MKKGSWALKIAIGVGLVLVVKKLYDEAPTFFEKMDDFEEDDFEEDDLEEDDLLDW